jgi:hypothetical protein
VDFKLEFVVDVASLKGVDWSAAAATTIEGIKGTLSARDDSAYSHRRISYLLMLFSIDSLLN